MKLAQFFRDNKDWLDMADNILSSLDQARDGGLFSKVIAGASIANVVLDNIVPENNVDEIIRRRGYHYVQNSIAGFLSEVLANEPMSFEIEIDHEKLRFWEDPNGDGGVAFLYGNGGMYVDGPYLLGGDTEYMNRLVYSVVWADDKDLMLSINDGERSSWRAVRKFHLDILSECGPYISTKGAEVYAERLKRYKNRSRTVLLEGPSGVGKSVLARHIANLVADEGAHTLKVSGETLMDCRSNELVALVRCIQPSVFLIDDLETRYHRLDDFLLDIFENLQSSNCLVLVTSMVAKPNKKKKRGGGYVEGRRPGRIDEIITVLAPNITNRGLILHHFYEEFGVEPLPKEIHKKVIELTDGVTGAYLMDFVDRLKLHGSKEWKTELDHVLYLAPPAKRKRKKPTKKGSTKASQSKKEVKEDLPADEE